VILVRAIVWSSLFIAAVLVLLPARLLSGTGVTRPPALGAGQVAGIALVLGGSVLALWCIGSFVVLGRGTPAPFDPPLRLVVRGPYRFVRNPMYLGAGLALLGLAIFYGSAAVLAYGLALAVGMHLLVLLYEEPTLREKFGDEYRAYCARVHRWLPSAGSPARAGNDRS